MMSVMDTIEDVLTQAHKHSMHNRPFLTGSVRCGCFHCQQTYAADEIKNWTDDGQTAICPRCGVDAVLSDRTDPLTADFLARMHTRWFEQASHVVLGVSPAPPTVSAVVTPRRAS